MYKETKLTISSAHGVKIPAIFAHDEIRPPQKGLLMLHGISTQKDEYLDFYRILAEGLARKGISTLRIDFRGHGESKVTPAGFTIASQLLDLVQSIRWLEQHTGFQKVSVLGTSFGAPPCLFAASIFPKKIDEVFLVAPVLDYVQTFISPISTWGKESFGRVVERTIVQGETIPLSDKFYMTADVVAEMLMIDIERLFRNNTKRIKIMHGNKDGMVDISITQDFAKRHGNIAFYMFDNMEHGFTDFGDEQGSNERTKSNIERMISIICGEE